MKKVLKLLYVEDDRLCQDIVKKALEFTSDYQFDISITPTSLEGLEMLRKEKFDIALTDYRMPGMDGIQMLKKIKEEGIETPIIIVTGTGDERIAVEAMKAGAYDYVVKDESYHASLHIVIERTLEKYQTVKERGKLMKALEEKVTELETQKVKLERVNEFMVGRELQMVELKKEVDSLLKELGRPNKYRYSEKE